MRTAHRGAVAIVLSLVIGLPPSQGEPVLAQTDQHPSNFFSELYRLNADPYQLENSCRTAESASIAKLEDQLKLQAQMRVFRSCATATCREAEDTP